MVKFDAWSTEEELAAKAQQPLSDPGSYRLSSDGWAWAIITGLCLIVAVLFVALHDLGNQINTLQTQVAFLCQEDMPCWDCNTMGNKICGPSK